MTTELHDLSIRQVTDEIRVQLGLGPGMMGNPSVHVPDRQRFASPEDIVRQRYAAGEITREEYLQMMEDLDRGQ